jgi:hypothetical protein
MEYVVRTACGEWLLCGWHLFTLANAAAEDEVAREGGSVNQVDPATRGDWADLVRRKEESVSGMVSSGHQDHSGATSGPAHEMSHVIPAEDDVSQAQESDSDVEAEGKQVPAGGDNKTTVTGFEFLVSLLTVSAQSVRWLDR